MSNFTDNIKSIGEIAKVGTKLVKNKVATGQMKRKIKQRYLDDLPITLMGETNFNTAAKEIKRYVKTGDYEGAKSYTKSQLEKIQEQVKGTLSEENIVERLRRYNN